MNACPTKICKRVGKVICTGILFIVFLGQAKAEDGVNDSKTKAMFIINFLKYVAWPDKNEGDIIKIGIAGESDLFEALLAETENKPRANNILVQQINPETRGSFQIIIIPHTENKKLASWIKKYNHTGVLIITDEWKNPEYATINLIKVNNKIRFQINNKQARLCGLKISSRLTDLASTVQN